MMKMSSAVAIVGMLGAVSPWGDSDKAVLPVVAAPPAGVLKLESYVPEYAGGFMTASCAPCSCCDGGCVRMEVKLGTGTPGFEPKLCGTEGCGKSCDTGVLGADFNLLLDAVRSGDVNGIGMFLAAHPASVLVNHERRSLTVMACNGVAANLPIDAIVLDQISE
ncbi:MAG: hypothetical protein RQ751_06195 [Longimicrobiales bacterium]|nr:hypothetical protein [Longimicrobiales bacterium]